MSLKEFDAKQFLLEKGEQVGLGVALTLMVLMLVVSLFLPSRGFMSGNPEAKAKPLVDGSANLDKELKSRQLPDQERPPKPEDRLIALDTDLLRLDQYAMGPLFEPTAPENPARRPPTILALDDALAAVAYVPIDTYIFDKNFAHIVILTEDKPSSANNNAAGGNNPVARRYNRASSTAGGAGGRFGNIAAEKLRGIQAADEKHEYETKLVPLDKLSGSEHLARQLQPTRMVLIEGSFPYKDQLLEFQRKLGLDSIQKVLSETVDEDKDKKESKLYAFRFLGVDVERREVDANDKPVGEWTKLKLAEQYKVWLMNSGLPFEPEDPKYDAVKPLNGLAMPLLREFHQEPPQNQLGMKALGMAPASRPGMSREAPSKPAESNYPDLASKLKPIQNTLAKLADVDPRQIATQSSTKFSSHEDFNPFSLNTGTSEAENAPAPVKPTKVGEQAAPDEVIPEHCLVRLVDMDIKPGKAYRYRFKVRMANPNYNREDVASTAYKAEKELESREWFPLKNTVRVPLETIYYAVDQKYQADTKSEKHPKESPQWDMWKTGHEPAHDREVVFQLHRWLDATPIGGTMTPIGDWAIADRVFVARGEAVGRTVKVDLPVWKYSQDAYVLPAEDQKARKRNGKVPSGVFVNFGQDDLENETLLLDFEGGREAIREAKLDDIRAIEVLMLSPEGKLLARSSGKDANDKTRKDRREKVQKRIENVRAGKSGGAGAAGGLDRPRGK